MTAVVLVFLMGCLNQSTTAHSPLMQVDTSLPVTSLKLRDLAEQRIGLARNEVATIGGAVEEFTEVSRTKAYPGANDLPATVRERLGAELPSTIVPLLPERDPWGSPYLYWSDGRDYFVLSYGPDMSPDDDYLELVRTLERVAQDLSTKDDILWIDGSFYPAGKPAR
jgi:hypothetical protein